jgi:hypothetical protein
MKQNSCNSSDGGTAVGNYAAGNCAGHVSLLPTEMSYRDDPSCVMWRRVAGSVVPPS